MLGLIVPRLDPVIPKGRIVFNVDVSGLDPVIPKGRIVQDVSSGLDPVILKGRIFHNVSKWTRSRNSQRKDHGCQYWT